MDTERDGRLDDLGDWRGRAAAASKVRMSGPALDIRVEWDETDGAAPCLVFEPIRKKVEKSLRSGLNKTHQLDLIKHEASAVNLVVSANTTYVSAGALRISDRLPWPSHVDKAVEDIRQLVASQLRANADELVPVQASWTPGAGVYVEGTTIDERASAREIQERLRELGDHRRRAELTRWVIVGAAGAAALAGLLIAVITREAFFAAYIAAYGVLALVLLPIPGRRIGALRDEIASSKEQLDLQGLLDEEERRAFRLFQLHNSELKRYYDSALGQRRAIFGLGIFCILLGASIAIVALALLSASPTTDQEKILITGMGAIGAVLTNFVAIIYLRMFRDTVASMNVFHTRLVSTNHLLFGNLLAARIDDSKERDDTLSRMAAAVARADQTDLGGSPK